VSPAARRPTTTASPVAILTLKCQQLASSSRSQVLAATTSAAVCLAWDRPSMDVRWRPPLAVAIVTHFVTQWFVRAWMAIWSGRPG
jgi:hypothetical protein